jgi:hypothetical protein
MKIECWLAKDWNGRVYAFTGSPPEDDSSDGEKVFFIAADDDASDCLTQLELGDDKFPELPAGQYCRATITLAMVGEPMKPATK